VIVDSSAIVAVQRLEAESERFLEILGEPWIFRISAATFLECSIVLDGSRDGVLSARYDAFLSEFGIIIEPVTEIQAKIARQAYREFGRGSGSSAQLNFGDCFSYALAKDRNEPLLYKGNDFMHTDVRSAMGER